MELKDAEWIVEQHKQGSYSFAQDIIDKAYNLLENSPYIDYECEFCEVEYSSRKNSDEELARLCHKCYLRMGSK